MAAHLTRTLKKGSFGKDVEACARACFRFLHEGDLTEFAAKPLQARRTYDAASVKLTKRVQKLLGQPQSGVLGQATFLGLLTADAFDAFALKLLAVPELRTLVYPHPASATSSFSPNWIHETSGLEGNIAIDFLTKGGTKVLTVEAGTITRLSGHDPATGVHGTSVFGFSIYYETRAGYEYFSTHYGKRFVSVGQEVPAGFVIGEVGSWPHDPGRSHTHLGVTSPKGLADARSRILAVGAARRI